MVATTRSLPTLDSVGVFAREVALRLEAGDLLRLDGPLGAGKTTFVRALVAALDGDPGQVSSPTFTLMHHYQTRLPVLHLDAYRLAPGADLMSLGLEDLQPEAVTCLEWAERCPGHEAANRTWRFRFSSGHERSVSFSVEPSQEGA